MKPFEKLTDEEILEDALRAVPDYLADLGKEGDFSMERCLRRCIERVKYLYKKSAGPIIWPNFPTSSRTLTKEQIEDLTRICVRLDAPLRKRIEPIRQRFLKKRAVYRINSTTAASLIPAAFKEAGLQAMVTAQQYRAKVEVTLPKGNRLRFYINYKDLTKEGVIDGVITAVSDLNNALSRLGGPVAIK
ncbi:MAG: hypothetical protein J6P46_02120 [Bacteroidales bacterium]|nr:hypothetical protein [Bacteroidales bacterium]